MERPLRPGYEHETSNEMDLVVTLEACLDEIDTLWREYLAHKGRSWPDLKTLALRLCAAYESLQRTCGFDPDGGVPTRDGNAILCDALCQAIFEQAGDQVKADELIERIAHEIASYRQHLSDMLKLKQ